MQLASQQLLPVAQEAAWDALNDIELLQQAIPGCESMTATGEHQYELVVATAIGPVKARFKSRLALLDVQAPQSYTMQFDGQGGTAGHGKGVAKVRLEPADGGTTRLHYTVTAQVGGKLAQVGSRLVDLAAQKLAKDFFTSFEQAIVARYGAPAAPATAAEAAAETTPPGFFARLWRALRRLFAGTD